MKEYKKDDIRNFENVPLFFSYMNRIQLKKDVPTIRKQEVIETDFYQTNNKKAYPFYKPISRIISQAPDI